MQGENLALSFGQWALGFEQWALISKLKNQV